MSEESHRVRTRHQYYYIKPKVWAEAEGRPGTHIDFGDRKNIDEGTEVDWFPAKKLLVVVDGPYAGWVAPYVNGNNFDSIPPLELLARAAE